MDNLKLKLKLFQEILITLFAIVFYFLEIDVYTKVITTSFIVFKLVDIELALSDVKNIKLVKIVSLIDVFLKSSIVLLIIKFSI